MLVVLSSPISSLQALATRKVCMNFFACPTLKKYRFCLPPFSSMICFFSLNWTLASVRVGTSINGFFPLLTSWSVDLASPSSFLVVAVACFSLAMARPPSPSPPRPSSAAC